MSNDTLPNLIQKIIRREKAQIHKAEEKILENIEKAVPPVPHIHAPTLDE